MQTIDRYELLGRVAGGTTAVIWKARDPQLNREVAIKQLAPGAEHLRAQWRAEARTLATLDNEHIVAIYDFLEDANGAYIVEEWIEGATLGKLLATGVRLSGEQAVGVLRGALIGLSYAHARGVVHRDVSPANILIDQSGVSKLVDFGLASQTGSLGSSGARAYLSPEALAGQPVTPRSDVYSAAALLAHLLRGRPTTPPSASGIEQPLAHVISVSLSDDPAQRPPTAAELLAWLEQNAALRFGGGWLAQAGVGALVTAVGAVPIIAVTGTAAAAGVAGAGTLAGGSTAAASTAAAPAAVTASATTVGGSMPATTSAVGSGVPGGAGVGGGMPVGSGVGTAGPGSPPGGVGSGMHAGGSHSASSVGHGIGKSALLKIGVAAAVVVAAGTVAAVALTGGGDDGGQKISGLRGSSDLYAVVDPAKAKSTLSAYGTVPHAISVKSGDSTVTFPSVTGKIGCCTSTDQEHGPDGDNLKDFGHGTDITAMFGISGVKHSTQTLFLSGVFLGSTPPTQTGQVDLSKGNQTSVQAPELGQIFFVGDGKTDKGVRQKVVVPSGATKLYLGFVDASAFVGPPGFYDDNPGSLDVQVKFSSSTAHGLALPVVASSTSSTTTPPPVPSSTAPSSEVPVSSLPPLSSSSAPPPVNTISIDGPPLLFSFEPTLPDPSQAGFQATTGTIYLHVPQVTQNLAEPFLRITIVNETDGSTIASPDLTGPTPDAGLPIDIPADGQYVLNVVPAGTGSGTVTVGLTSH